MNYLFTLCGRAGSKGVKGKNVRSFCGVPLVWYSLAAMSLFKENYLNSEDSMDIVLNTDSDELISLCKKQTEIEIGIIHREQELAGDKASKVAVIRSSLIQAEAMNNKKYDIVVDLDITSPLRTVKDVNAAIEQKKSRRDTDVVFSVTESRRNPYFNMVKADGEYFGKAIPSTYTARQQAPVFYDMNASIYAYDSMRLKEKDSNIFFNDHCDIIVMKDTGILDIDSEEDYEMLQVIADYLFKNNDGFSLIYKKAYEWKNTV